MVEAAAAATAAVAGIYNKPAHTGLVQSSDVGSVNCIIAGMAVSTLLK